MPYTDIAVENFTHDEFTVCGLCGAIVWNELGRRQEHDDWHARIEWIAQNSGKK
jgi:hypothetical protein